MMKKNSKIVVVWGGESILCSSIQHLLAAEQDWTVVSVSNMHDFEAIFPSINNNFSDIVIIHPAEHDKPGDLPLQLLHEHADIRVITISLENNVMNIYNKQSLLVKEASDLITVIENEAKPQEVIIHSVWR